MPHPAKVKSLPGPVVSPFYSGLGIEFSPLGVTDSPVSPILHETGYLPNNSKWNFPSVLSPFWRIYYNLDPGHQFFVNNQAYDLTPGCLYVIPSDIFIHCLGELPVRHFWMAFSLPNRRLDLTESKPFALTPSAEEGALMTNISRLIEEHRKRAENSNNEVYHQSMALIHLVLGRSNLTWRPPFPESFSRLLDYIKQNAPEPLSNQHLAERSGMSIATLCRTFQSCLKTTPANYVTQVRITRAVLLLEQTDRSIDTIAEQLGFPNRAYFSRVFKKVTTLPPGEYRKRRTIHRRTTGATKGGA